MDNLEHSVLPVTLVLTVVKMEAAVSVLPIQGLI
jgi:hypothetical protein